MRSQVVNVGSSTTSSSPSTTPASDSKRSVFERLGRQIDTNAAPLTPGSKVSNANQPSSSIVREPLPGPSTQASSIKKRLTDPLWEASSERRRQTRSRYIDSAEIICQTENSNNNTKNTMDPPISHESKSSINATTIGNRPQSPSSQAGMAPKYDRHGNLIISLREKRRLQNHTRWPSSSRRSGNSEFFQHHHPLNREMEHRQPGPPLYPPSIKGSSMNRDHSFNNMTQYSANNHPRNSPSSHTPSHNINNQHSGEEASRYVKWRERRNAITSLDKEAARSNSRTNSLKNTLQSTNKDNGSSASNLKLSPLLNNNSSSPKIGTFTETKPENINPLDQSTLKSPSTSNNGQASTLDEPATKRKKNSSHANKEPPIDMSDGEIVDDDSSEEEIVQSNEKKSDETVQQQQQYYQKNYNHSSRYPEHSNSMMPSNNRIKERNPHDEISDDDALHMGAKIRSASSPRLNSISVWEVNKIADSKASLKREINSKCHDSRENRNRDTDSMLSEPPTKRKYCDTVVDQKDNSSADNLETISDDEFDAMIDEDQNPSTKGSSSFYPDDTKIFKDKHEQIQSQTTNGSVQPKSTCTDKGESELIKALGIDWANLCDLAKKQSKSREVFTPGCARLRFTAPYYLKTLRISPELAGEELMNQINKICGRIELKEDTKTESLSYPQIKEEHINSNSPLGIVEANEISPTNINSLTQLQDRNTSISSPDLTLDKQAFGKPIDT